MQGGPKEQLIRYYIWTLFGDGTGSVSNETETLESLDNFSVSKSRDRKYRDFRDFRDQIY